MAKVILTGASGGFGKLTLQTLLKAKHQVAATMRDISGKNKIHAAEFKKLGAHVVEMDVTKDESVNSGILQAAQALGGFDVVVNNAGVGVIGLQETFTTADWQKIFDVNVFGVQRVCRAALPQMREKKSGLIINVSSLLGRITVPFYGPYNASKWALEALSENYRAETSSFGVEVCIVEPGGFPTTFVDNLVRPSDKTRDKSYGELAKMSEGFLETFEKAMASNPAQNPQLVADAILQLVDTPRGKRAFRTVVDKMGMGDMLKGYNEQLQQITTGIYTNFGMADWINVKT